MVPVSSVEEHPIVNTVELKRDCFSNKHPHPSSMPEYTLSRTRLPPSFDIDILLSLSVHAYNALDPFIKKIET